MNVVILGAGKTGAYVASILSEEGHSVTVIDRDGPLLEKLGRELDVATLHTSAPDVKAFVDLLEGKPDLFLAASGHDETNVVSCCLAKQLGFPKAIARVHSGDYLEHTRFDAGRMFSVDHFIAPDVLAAQDLFKGLIHTGDVAVEHFAHGAIQMRTIQIPDLWDRGGTPIAELALPGSLLVGLIRRKTADGEIILFPHGDDHILPGDEATVVGEAKAIHHLHEIFHIPERPVRSIILVGGSPLALQLARLLEREPVSVRIIEANTTRCVELAEMLPRATIINRDGRDFHLLQSEHVENADALISCTYHDGDNLLIGALAKGLGCPKAIGVITDASYSSVLEKLGVIPALSARVNVVNRVLSILHEKIILSVASLCNDLAKIVEIKISATCPLIDIPFSKLHLPKELLICAMENRGNVTIGRGPQRLQAGDTAIVICASHQIPKLQELFQP